MTFSVSLIVVTSLNLAVWGIAFFVFRKHFSPETILTNIRKEVDKLLIAISHETDNDLQLLEDKLGEIRMAQKYTEYLIKELDRRGVDLDSTLGGEPFSDGQVKEPAPPLFKEPTPEERYIQGLRNAANEPAHVDISPEVVELSLSPDQQPVSATKPAAPVRSPAAPASAQAARAPVAAESPAAPKQTAAPSPSGAGVMRQKVLELWNIGVPVTEITERLNVSLNEVQMIIDMFG